jgi:hypothetical protein
VRHGYSHFTVELHAFVGHVRAPFSSMKRSPVRRWVTRAELDQLPLPKATERVVALLDAMGRASPGSGSHRGRTRASPRTGGRPLRRLAPRRDTAASADRSHAPR